MHNGYVKRYKKKSSGQSLVEFALILPVAMWMLVGAVDFGRFVVSYSEAASICQDAARYGRQIDPETGYPRTVEAIQERVWSTLPAGVTSADITQLDIVLNTSVQGLQATKVSVVYTIPCLMPLSQRFFENGLMSIRGTGIFVRNM